MAKAQNWFMEGWTYQARPDRTGRLRKTLVYTGPVFSFGLSRAGLRWLKAAYGALMVIVTAVYILIALWGSGGQEQFYVGAPFMLAMVPGMYMLLGSAWLLGVTEPLTYRDACGSLRRIRRAAYFSLPLYSIALLGQLVYCCLGRAPALGRELLWAAGVLCCAAATAAQLYLTRRFPARLVPEKH